MKFATQLVRFEAAPGDPFKPVATPIYQTATFEQEEADHFGAYDYSRSGNPTRSVLESQLARLEHGTKAFCFASGLAAISAVVRTLSSGDHIVAGNDLYGGTFRLFSKILVRTGINVTYVDACDLNSIKRAITPRTKLIYTETPTNPLLRITDIAAVAEVAHSAKALLCVDSSAMSPYLQNPLDLGADIVVHSATKYLCGHSDVTAGVVVVKSEDVAQQVYFVQNGEGAGLSPFDSYLLLRGLKTLKLRLDCQQKSAQIVAEFLERHPLVQRVHYPGLAAHDGAQLHRRQARGSGAVLSFETGSFEMSKRVVEELRLFQITVSFGSVNSSASLPGCMSHASVPPEIRKHCHVPVDLVRLSIGIEDSADLIADLQSALATVEVRLPVTNESRASAAD
jgi:cysteine-S-conjugate beta-lyase